jgi:DNA-binding NtrC family response regulator
MTSSSVSSIRLDALLGQAREPAFLLGPDRRFIGVNGAFEELVGHPSEQLIGLLCSPHSPTKAGDIDGLGGSFSPPPEAIAGQPTGTTTLILRPTDGERLVRRLEFWPFHDKNGKLTGLFCLVREEHSRALVDDSLAHRLRVELLETRVKLQRRHGFDSIVGQGVAHRRLLDQVQAAAASNVSLLIVGDPGVGKRTVARAIHALSLNHEKPLYTFDPAALPPELLMDKWFGRQPESDQTSDCRPEGPPSLAFPEGSTFLINEIAELSRDLQGMLSQALDGRVRVIATTTADPEVALKNDRLRPDLYYALTSIVIRLRPLRERIEELPVLAQYQLERANQRGARQREGFTSQAIEAIQAYDWPGNLRELSRVIDAAHLVGHHDLIQAEDLPAEIRGHLGAAYQPPPAPNPTPLDELLNQVERKLIEQSLVRAHQNKSRAAELLGISRPRLYRRIKELGIADDPEAIEENNETG